MWHRAVLALGFFLCCALAAAQAQDEPTPVAPSPRAKKVDDTKPKVDDTKPKVDDTKPKVDDTKPKIDDTKKPEVKKPEEKKPETKKPEEKKTEEKKPETKKPEEKKPEEKKPEDKKPEEKKPEEKKPEEKKPEEKKPKDDTKKPEEKKPEEKKPEEKKPKDDTKKPKDDGVMVVSFEGHYEKNNSGLSGAASHLVFTSAAEFEKVFASVPKLADGKALKTVAKDVFDKHVVVVVVKRGPVVYNYQLGKATVEGDTLTVRYTPVATSAGGGANFASPLILGVEKGTIKKVVFAEAGSSTGYVVEVKAGQ